MSSRVLTADEARAQLYEIMAEDLSFEEKADRALDLGEAYLGVQNAHLTKIDARIDFWESIASTDPPDGAFPAGEVLDLQTTYCRRVIERGSSIALSDAPNEGWADDPAFEAHGLHCYHGTPLTIDGDVFGTLCFVSEDPREAPFSESETLFAELIARMLEHELRHSRQASELNLQSSLIGVLSHVLRHNLRNDLNVIRGQLTLRADRGDEPLMRNEPAIKKIDKLVDLANTARQIESIASSDLDSQPVELNTLVDHVIGRIESKYPAATFAVGGPDEVYVEAIPTLRTAIEELIENAAKHSGDAPEVTVSLDESAVDVSIQISDNGPGLPRHERDVLREGSESPLIHGSGLGLWLTYWIVANHDGSIRTDVTDEGTSVTVTLPKTSSLSEFADSETLLGQFHREQDKFEAVFEESFDAIVIFDDEGHLTDVNESAGELFGLPQKELRGQPIKEFLPDDYPVTEAWHSFQEAGRERDQFTLHQADGTPRTVEYTAVTDIVPGQHLAILRDCTERIEREEALEETTQRLQAIVEASPDPIIAVDSDGVVRFWNEAAEDVFGYAEAEAIGEPLRSLDLHLAGEADQFEDRLARALGGETFSGLEVHRQSKDGEDRYLTLSTARLEVDDGTLTGIMGVAKDITELRERERELAHREEAFRRLYEITADDSQPVNERIESLLEATREAIGTDYGTFSHIQDDEYGFEAVDVASGIDLESGTKVPLSDLPICQRVFETGEPLAIDDIEAEVPELVDPAWGISCYVGAPVHIDGEPYGTFCFYDVEPRDEPFTDWEKTIVEFLGDWVGMVLTDVRGPLAET